MSMNLDRKFLHEESLKGGEQMRIFNRKKEAKEPTVHDFSGTLGQRIRAVRETKEYGATDTRRVSRSELSPRNPSGYDYNKNTDISDNSGNRSPDDRTANVSRNKSSSGQIRGTMIHRSGAKTLTGHSVVPDRPDTVQNSGSD